MRSAQAQTTALSQGQNKPAPKWLRQLELMQVNYKVMNSFKKTVSEKPVILIPYLQDKCPHSLATIKLINSIFKSRDMFKIYLRLRLRI